MITKRQRPVRSNSNVKTICLASCVLLLALLCRPVEAQRSKIPRVGILITSSTAAIAPRMEAFQRGLRELGYVEGKNIIIEPRYAEGKSEQLRALAADLVSLKVDVIVTSGPTATRPAKEATSTIPIVMTFDDDPVGSGFVATLARPSGNITGLSTLAPEIGGKRLELLKETVPRLGRVAVVGTSSRQERNGIRRGWIRREAAISECAESSRHRECIPSGEPGTR